MIRSAILLAAGRGKRQRPFTDSLPKPLLSVRGRPTLDYVLIAIKRAGIERVCIVTNHLEQKVFDYVGDGSIWNLKADFAHQKELQGSGDALMSVPRSWLREETTLVAATDYILEEDVLLELIQAHSQYEADITISLKECPVDEQVSRSSVDVDTNWRVRRIIEKPTREQVMSPYAASVLYIFPPILWTYLPKIQTSRRGEIELPSAVQMMIDDGFKTYGVLQSAPVEWDKNFHLPSDNNTENF